MVCKQHQCVCWCVCQRWERKRNGGTEDDKREKEQDGTTDGDEM